LPALIMAVERNLDGLFLFGGRSVGLGAHRANDFHCSLVGAIDELIAVLLNTHDGRYVGLHERVD
jgi:hypothetical protein